MARKLKSMVTVELPTVFVEFIREVHELILEDHDATTTESDDLLQTEHIFGGLYNATLGRYGFCYYRDDDAQWHFDLNAQQIEEIASGAVTKVQLWQCENEQCKCLFPSADDYCGSCDSIRHYDDYESRVPVWYPAASDEAIMTMAQLRKIGLAIIDYQQEHGQFPPPYTVSSDGTPLHSWRALLLPFLDFDDLFARIDFTTPWDSDENRQLWEEQPDVYQSEGCEHSETRCLAIVDVDTIWLPGGGRSREDVKSGTSYTIAAVYSRNSYASWMQPVDIDLATAESEYESLGSLLAVFVDGHVETITPEGGSSLEQLARIT